jgi:predicted DNA-binding protein with PD1-like motif
MKIQGRHILYDLAPLKEQVEVMSLVGSIALSGNEPKVHAHVVVGKADGTAHGGHLLEAHVWPTPEVIITESPLSRALARRLAQSSVTSCWGLPP